MRAARALVVATALVLAGCSSGSDGDDPPRSTTSTSTSTSTTSTTAPFDGSTDPTTLPLSRDDSAPLRTVTLAHEAGVDRVTFEFMGPGVPKVDVGLTDDPVADGSGDPVAVDGAAALQVRFEPAATHELRDERMARVYDGPDRVRGDTTQVTEAVLGGSFEGVLTFFVGLREAGRFRVTARGSSIIVELAAP